MFRASQMTTAMDRMLEETFRSSPRSISVPLLVPLLLKQWYSDNERSMPLRRLLLDCLSHLEPEHASIVTTAHREQLYVELRRKRNDPYLVCAILKGLTGIEDHAPVYDVIVLAHGSRSAAEFPQIQTAAREYLLALGYSL